MNTFEYIVTDRYATYKESTNVYERATKIFQKKRHQREQCFIVCYILTKWFQYFWPITIISVINRFLYVGTPCYITMSRCKS